MRSQSRTGTSAASIGNLIQRVLGETRVEAIARETGMLQRKREITPLGLAVACISALAVGTTVWLADIHRCLNRFLGTSVQYKPFHNQLSKVQFAEFFRRLLEQAVATWVLPTIEPDTRCKLRRFKDIRIHDGTSMAIKDCLASVWPGRFNKVSPAAIELHVTMSALSDSVTRLVLAADKESERRFLPRAHSFRDILLLADRGFEDRDYMMAIDETGGFFIIRGKRNIRPVIRKAFDEYGCEVRRLRGLQLRWEVLDNHPLDIEVDWGAGFNYLRERIVVIPIRDKRNRRTYTYLHTNLPRGEFNAIMVGKLYRLRWQIELLFKEWKSYGNLHRFDTSKASIAQGLIWASLLGAVLQRFIAHAAQHILGIGISTQRVVASARHYLDSILGVILRNADRLPRAILETFQFMRDNTRRAHPKRDRQKGRLSCGLRFVGVS